MKSFRHCNSCKINKNIPSLNTVEDAGMFFMDWVLDPEFQRINKKLFAEKQLFATMFIPFEIFHYPKPLNFSFTKTSVFFPNLQGSKDKLRNDMWKKTKRKEHFTNDLQKRKKINISNNEFLYKCHSTNDCLMFGELQNQVIKYFDSFSSFMYLKNSPNTIGKKNLGANSVVRELVFQRDLFLSSILLKTNLNKTKDSIVYEYIAGKQYMNYINMYSPIFIQTYDLFVLSSQFDSVTGGQVNEWVSKLQQPNELRKEIFSDYLFPVNPEKVLINFLKLCNESVLSISLQFINKSQTFVSWLEDSSSFEKQHELILILFQIYFNLMRLKQTFTHYDLHLKNVLIYEVDPKKYYYYQYQMPNKQIISFSSSFVVKIIDYGRCYFDNRLFSTSDKREKNKNTFTEMNSTTIYNLAKRQQDCQRLFPFSSSFMRLHKEDFLLPYIFNPSQDLRLLSSLIFYGNLGYQSSIKEDQNLSENCKTLMTRITLIKEKEKIKNKSNVVHLPFDYKFGTKPIFQRGYKSIHLPNFIYNHLLSFNKDIAKNSTRWFLKKAIRKNKKIISRSKYNLTHKNKKKLI